MTGFVGIKDDFNAFAGMTGILWNGGYFEAAACTRMGVSGAGMTDIFGNDESFEDFLEWPKEEGYFNPRGKSVYIGAFNTFVNIDDTFRMCVNLPNKRHFRHAA